MKLSGEPFTAQGLLRLAALLGVITMAPVVLWLSVSLHPAASAWAAGEWGAAMWTQVWAQAWAHYGDSVDRSLRLATACMAVAMLVAMPCAQVWMNSRSRWLAHGAALLQRPMAVPGLATVLALLLAATPSQGLLRDFGVVLLAHLALTLPFVVQRIAAVLQGSASGAGAPADPSAVARAALNACLLAFALSLGESSLSALLNAPLAPPWPAGLVAMRTEMGTACGAVVAAIALPLLWGLRTIAEALGAGPVNPSWAGRS